MAVMYVLGEVVYEVPAHELIDKGWLAKPTIHIKTLVEDLKGEYNYYKSNTDDSPKMTYKKFKREFYPEYSLEKTYLQSNKNRRQWIADRVDTEVKKTGNAFVLVNNIPFGRKLADAIDNAYFVYGQDETEVRKKIYALFADNDNIVVVTTFQLASTGLNIKRIFNLFLIDAGKSFIQVIQSIGRGLRKAKDKNSVTIFDVNSDLKYGEKHLKERISYYKEAKYEHNIELVDYESPQTELLDNNADILIY